MQDYTLCKVGFQDCKLFISLVIILQLVLALYPQTTCFYRALIHEPPKRVNFLLFSICFTYHSLSPNNCVSDVVPNYRRKAQNITGNTYKQVKELPGGGDQQYGGAQIYLN